MATVRRPSASSTIPSGIGFRLPGWNLGSAGGGRGGRAGAPRETLPTPPLLRHDREVRPSGISREQPDLPCTVLFSESERQVLAAQFKPEALRTAEVLTLDEAVRYTARLGGVLCRKGGRAARAQTP